MGIREDMPLEPVYDVNRQVNGFGYEYLPEKEVEGEIVVDVVQIENKEQK